MQQTLTSPIRSARHAAGLSQADLAGTLGVSKSAVSAWEAGREFPAATRLAAIDRALAPHFDVNAFARYAEQVAGAAA